MTPTVFRAQCLLAGEDSPAAIRPARIQIHDGVISAIDDLSSSSEIDVPGILTPGFIDLQINGMDTDDLWEIALAGDIASWQRLESRLLDQGVTSWCPTYITAPLPHYAALRTFLDHLQLHMASKSSAPAPHPAVLGLHLEGPFLGSRVGAHSSRATKEPDWSVIADLASEIALITLGAESDGAADLCDRARQHGIVVALGHTAPSHEQFLALRDAGATMVTHLFNAMSGLHHRDPGLAAWALTDDELYCSVIADGVHVDPALLRLAFRARPHHMVLITDRVALGHPRLRAANGAVHTLDGKLAGSLLTMSDAIRTCVDQAGTPLAQTLQAATTHPAQVLGLTDRGRIAVGARADLVALDEDYRVRSVWVAGQQVR